AERAQQAGPRRQLVIEPHAALLLVVDAVEDDVERRVGRIPGAGPRLALVLVVRDGVDTVPDERTADRQAEPLVVDRLDLVQDRVLGVEAAVAEVAAEEARHLVAARLADG